MTAYPPVPAGWAVVDRRTAGPFTTAVTYARPDGGTVAWSSRAGRKHPRRSSAQRNRALWSPHRTWWWIAVLFAAGSACFLVAPFPVFLRWVGPQADAAVFFAGSLLFTSAAALQWVETVNADPGPLAEARRPLRWLAWEPRRIDWWSSSVQLVGTVAFNVTTFLALSTAVSSPSYNRLVWRPDAIGSVCFLVSGCLAYAEVSNGLLRRPPHSLEGGIVSVNLVGCLAFGVSAAASYVLPATGGQVDVTVANAGTAAGALAFLVGAVLLLPEGARTPAGAPSPVQ